VASEHADLGQCRCMITIFCNFLQFLTKKFKKITASVPGVGRDCLKCVICIWASASLIN
jgi:hypothetical protein